MKGCFICRYGTIMIHESNFEILALVVWLNKINL